jgi:phenylacetate-CoA ligase
MGNNMDEIEKLAFEECQEKIEKSLLSRQMRYVLDNSPFYQNKFLEAGIPTKDLSEVLDYFNELPFTQKGEILAEQKDYPPFGRLATGNNLANLQRVHITSGSTGRPVYIVLTANDLAATVEAGRRAFCCAGLRPEDTVVHCLNYCLWAGGVTDHLNLEATGATVVPFGVGNTKNLIKTIMVIRPTAISCTPSYLSRLEFVLQTEFKLRPQDLGLKKAFLGAEPGIQNPAFREKIEKIWDLRAIDANYGMADILSIFGAECEARQGLHFHGQGILYLELIDPRTGKNLPLQTGQMGEMVLTNLRREAQPMVRFRTRDYIQIVSTERCSCGRKSPRFLVLGRTDDVIVVRGINVFPDAVGNLLSQEPHLFSGEFEFVLETPPPIERPLLLVELARMDSGVDNETLKANLLQKLAQNFNFTPRLEFIPFGEFPRTEGKSRRVRRLY